MSRFFQRPENALKRSEDLLGVNQPAAALTLLFDVLTNKRNKSTSVNIMEPITFKFIELSVEQRKGKFVREVLHKYKLTYQTTDMESVVNVMNYYVKVSENKVKEAQATADKIIVDENIEDLEASETPESILLSTVSSELDKDRTDREIVTPWLKFLWEAYKTVLETIRKKRDPTIKNNNLIDEFQQKVAKQAFEFCLTHSRKTEFHRLCVILKGDLLVLAKHGISAFTVDDNELIQRYLNTRFIQLNTATELQLWQKAFETAEDIQLLFNISKKISKPHLADYYNKLAKIFTVGENHLFQAAALGKFYNIMRQKQDLSKEDQQKLASKVLISALSVPIINNNNNFNDGRDNNTQLLINLLRVQKTPTRELLLNDIFAKNVYNNVSPEVKELYQILEVEFHPLLITKKVAPILKTLKENEELKDYIAPLQDVILTRILQQLSQVYTTVKIDFVVNQTTFKDGDLAFSAIDIERFIMNGNKKEELNIRINHQDKTISFTNDVFSGNRTTASVGPKLVSLPVDQIRTQISRLAKRLHAASHLIETTKVEQGISTVTKAANKSKIFTAARQRMEIERRAINARTELLLKKVESRQNSVLLEEIEKDEQRRIKQEGEKELEKIRLENEIKRREKEQQDQLLQSIAKTAAAERIAEFQAKMKANNIKVDIKDTENIDSEGLINLQIEYLEQQQKEKVSKIKSAFKKLDHTVRTLHKEEIQLLSNDYDKQKIRDRKLYDLIKNTTEKASEIKYKQDIETKKRLLRMVKESKLLENERGKEYKNQINKLTEENNKLKLDAKKKRIQMIKEKIAQEKRIEEEIQQRKLKEMNKKQEEAKRLEEMEKERIRMEEEKRAKLLSKQQQQNEQEEDNNNNNKYRPSISTEASNNDNNGVSWRRSGPKTPDLSRNSSENTSSNTNAFIPVHRRQQQQQQQQQPQQQDNSKKGLESEWIRKGPKNTNTSSSTSKPGAYIPPSRR